MSLLVDPRSMLRFRRGNTAHPSKFAETTVPFEVVPARGKAFAETEAATERMETIVDVACIFGERN